ncbi:MAG: DUF742 domain-containing protein [Actinomycetota bacterium]|nr:DUF742 domain-containing protein [Actinomycetota bacterium]
MADSDESVRLRQVAAARAGPAGSSEEPESGVPEEPAGEWDWSEPEELPVTVRPYTRTGGRTQPMHDLAVETLVVTGGAGRVPAEIISVEHVPIVHLCDQAHSVAEVSALLGLPLGVARVLLADLVELGLIEVLHNPTGEDGSRLLLERVLAGLRNL